MRQRGEVAETGRPALEGRTDAFSSVGDFVRETRESEARCGKALPFGRGAVYCGDCVGHQRREGRRALIHGSDESVGGRGLNLRECHGPG